jgi:hypothetical protein
MYQAVKSLPFWIAASGGVLLAVSTVAPIPTAGAVGGVLFLVGVILFVTIAVRRARDEGTGILISLRRGARDALRFAWYLMP